MRKKALLFIKLKFVFISLLITNYTWAQQDCYDNTHSVVVNDSWLSCNNSVSPNVARGNGHWIMYDLGYTYNLTTTHFWNYNVPGQVGQGIRDCIIDYSLDGNSWLNAASFELPIASGNTNYIGVSGPDLGGINARYVLLTANTTWGSNCAGLSEVRFDLGQQCAVNAQIVGLPATASNNSPITLTGMPAGGTFSGNGVVFNAFNPSIAGVGMHLIEYTYVDSQNDCSTTASQTVFVFAVNYVFVNYNLGIVAPKLNLNDELILSIEVPVDDKYAIQLNDIQGKSIFAKAVTLDKGLHDINILIGENFAKGIYLLTISNSYGSVNEKIIQSN